jgi:hypothetical protein
VDKIIMLGTVLMVATALSFAPAASAHEEGEAGGAGSEHFLGVVRDAPWIGRALAIRGLAVVGVYATRRR